MAWMKLTEFNLYPCDMCVGQPDFSPHIPQKLMYGIEKGKYKIQYVSGAVRSNNRQRYQRDGIQQYEKKWNKYYDISMIPSSVLSSYNFTFFPQIKLNVFQCQYGTLPGFTKDGAATKQLAQYYATNQNMVDQMYEIISGQVAPLQFEVNNLSNISFWYTDNCAPCVQGNICYALYQNIENVTMPVNSISVLSFNIHTLKPNKPEYYKMNINQANTLYTIPYVYQQNLLNQQKRKQYILNLKKYNTIGYGLNYSNIYLSYHNTYKTKHNSDVFWKIKKIKQYSLFNLITQITSTTTIPLFSGIYTIIPSLAMFFVYDNDEQDNSIIEYSLDGQQYIQKISDNIKQFTFSLEDTAQVTFYKPCYLYSGKVALEDILNADIEYTVNNQFTSDEINTIKQDINIVNSEFYLYITQESIQIISINVLNLRQNITAKFLYGPFKTIQQARASLINYCINNSFDYQQISDTIYAIGSKDV